MCKLPICWVMLRHHFLLLPPSILLVIFTKPNECPHGIERNVLQVQYQESKSRVLKQRLANFFCKEADGKYFRLFGNRVFVTTTLTPFVSRKSAMDSRPRNERGCVPIKFHLRTLKCEFCRTFTCCKMVFFKFFPSEYLTV